MLTPELRGIYKGKGRAHKNPWDLNEGMSQSPHDCHYLLASGLCHPAPEQASYSKTSLLLDPSCMSSFMSENLLMSSSHQFELLSNPSRFHHVEYSVTKDAGLTNSSEPL